jgi:hypothetical protein
MKNSVKFDGSIGYTTLNIQKNPLNCTLYMGELNDVNYISINLLCYFPLLRPCYWVTSHIKIDACMSWVGLLSRTNTGWR